MPKLLVEREPVFIKVVRGTQTFWRLRTGGFTNVADAKAFCAQVRLAGGACVAYDEQKPAAEPLSVSLPPAAAVGGSGHSGT